MRWKIFMQLNETEDFYYRLTEGEIEITRRENMRGLVLLKKKKKIATNIVSLVFDTFIMDNIEERKEKSKITQKKSTKI